MVLWTGGCLRVRVRLVVGSDLNWRVAEFETANAQTGWLLATRQTTASVSLHICSKLKETKGSGARRYLLVVLGWLLFVILYIPFVSIFLRIFDCTREDNGDFTLDSSDGTVSERIS